MLLGCFNLLQNKVEVMSHGRQITLATSVDNTHIITYLWVCICLYIYIRIYICVCTHTFVSVQRAVRTIDLGCGA